MKFSHAVLAISSLASSAFAAPKYATRKLLKAARRVEENEEEEEYQFLANYKLKLIGCKSGELYVNPENGENEYSSVVFRLCPADTCDNEGAAGCTSGNGDYVVGLNSFVENYLEDKRDDMQQDDAFKVEEFGECREYEVDDDAEDEEDGDEQEQQMYYVGPACSEDGTDIVLDMFVDETCTTKSDEVTFYDISNGLSLPYSGGGLVSSYCESCAGYNDDGEYEISEMCTNLYENAGKCETNMETFSNNGQQVESCEFIEAIIPRQSSAGTGKVVGWLFFAAFIVGAVYVGYGMMKKKDDRTASLMNA